MMRNLIFYLGTIVLMACLSANAFAQIDSIVIKNGETTFAEAKTPLRHEIQEVKKKMSDGEQNALRIFIPGAEKSQAENVWKDFMSQYDGKTRSRIFSSEYRTEDIHIYSVGGVDPVSVYATFEREKERNGVDAYIWFKLSETDYLSSSKHENAFREARRIADNYGLAVRQNIVRAELEKEEKLLSSYESDMKKLQRENEKLRETIEKAKSTIEKAEADLEKNTSNQKETLEKLKAQEKAVETARLKFNRTNN